MATAEIKSNSKTNGKVVHIFSHFMARIAKFEELASAGNSFLATFRQGLEFIRRPSIDNTSELFEKVINSNSTNRLQSYIKAGYGHPSTRTENLNKLNSSHIQLLHNASKAKIIVTELECLVEDVKLVLESATEALQDLMLDFDPLAPACDEELNVSSIPNKPEDVDYATMIAVVYSMVKQDYVMQEKIVSSLSLNTTSGELESYCLMWSLRPFVNDEIMHQAWRLIP